MPEPDSQKMTGGQPATVDPSEQNGQPLVPWENRRKLGTIIAYWKTVWLVLRTGGRLGPCLAGPVKFRDAKKFFLISMLHLLGILVVLAAVVTVAPPPVELTELYDVASEWIIAFFKPSGQEEWVEYAALLGALVIGMRFLAGIISWFFCPRSYSLEMQNRSIALSYYTAAPLGLAAPLMLPAIAAIGWMISCRDNDVLRWWLYLVPPGLILYWYVLALSAVRSVAKRRPATVAVMALAVPILWTAVLALLATVGVAIAVLVGMWASLT